MCRTGIGYYAWERKVDQLLIIEHACSMDIHKYSITRYIMIPKGKGIRTFSTKTVFLLQLIDWVKKHKCTPKFKRLRTALLSKSPDSYSNSTIIGSKSIRLLSL